jgi:hypothetical protein
MSLAKNIFVLIFIYLSFSFHAQNIKFDNYTTKDGLVSDEVYKIFQDKKGYIWMFTNYGSMKYNGKAFSPVLKNLSFDDCFIYAYYENKEGQLWVVNSNCKLYEVKNDSAFVIPNTEKISSNLFSNFIIVGDFMVDRKGDIYITTSTGLHKYSKNTNYKFSIVGQSSFHDFIYGYILENDNKTMISINYSSRFVTNRNAKMLFSFDYLEKEKTLMKKTYFAFTEINRSSTIPNTFNNYNGNLYFSFYYNLIKVKENKTVKIIPINAYILNYVIDKNGHLWVATLNNGLYELNQNDSIVGHYFTTKTINHLLIDTQNGLWFSTDGNGLFHCKNLNEIHYFEDNYFGNNIKFIKRVDSTLFLSNSHGDLTIIKKQKTLKCENKSKEQLLDIIKYKDGFVLCYFYHLDYLKIKNNVIKTKLPFIKPAFHPLKLLGIGQDTILGLSRNSFCILKKGIASLNEIRQLINLPYKTFDFNVRGNDVFFATVKGVLLFKSNVLSQPKFLKDIENIKVVSITKDNDENLWFITKGYGLFKLSEKNILSSYSIKNGLPSDIINSISFNENGSVLLATNKGLFTTTNFKKWDEVFPEQVKSVLNSDNKIYFTTKDGLVINKAIKLDFNKKFYFNLSSVIVNGSNVFFDINKENLLNYNQNNLIFKFDVLSYSYNIPDINYQLLGNDIKKGATKDQQLIFQNLKPGNYTLNLTLSSDKTKVMTLNFAIIPAFWQNNWFVVLSAVVVLVIFYAFIFIIFYLRRKRERKKNEINRLITEYKLIALKAQINPHFMSNCLTAIQHLILKNKVDEANQYIAKFSFLVRQVLNFSTKDLVSLHDELEIVKLNIELELLRFEHKFGFIIENSLDLNLEKVYVPPLITQPIIENAIWHGLLPLKKMRKGILKITILIDENKLLITIEDNGLGMMPKAESKTESKGIKITKQRIDNLRNLIDLNDYNLIHEPILDNLNSVIGTKVKIILPILNSDEYDEN